jgi:putative hydrolase of the HAD superfamily
LKNPKISAVLFDLDGTLRHNQPNGYLAFVEYLAELGHVLTPEQVREGHRWTHYYWSVSPEMRQDLEAFGGESPAFWVRHTERQLEAIGLAAEAPALALQLGALFDERYLPNHHIPDDAIPTLRRLHELGYVVGLVSNRRDPLEGLLAELGLADFFVFTLAAGQANSWKPDPGIFQQALELAGCAPEATVYVGDNYYADVEGARAAGLRPVLIDPHGIFPDPGCPIIQTLRELEDVLLQFE